MAQLLKGKEVVTVMNERIKAEVQHLKEQDITPTLGIIRIGERLDDISYEKGASKRCETLGVGVQKIVLAETVSQEELIKVIKALNVDKNIHGILLFCPLPKHLDEHKIKAAIEPEKDVDGITESSMAAVYANQKIGFPACTPQACIEILEHYKISLKGKKAVVIGRSLVIGKPIAMMLLQKDCTVTICHTKTENIQDIVKEADIVIAAAGQAQMIGRNYVSKEQTIIDVGIHVNEEGKLCGDVNSQEVETIVSAITPVPGGVGTVTTSVLVGHVVEAARNFYNKEN
jgi:5,10-methylene-tetrahydrofolate dehydrogenase/Methenyl tetrahydrofolate cyclohydrolase